MRYYHGRVERWVAEGRHHQDHQEDDSFTKIAASITSDIEKALKHKEYPTVEALKKKLPPEIRDLIPLFNKREADKLPPHRDGVDYRIEIREQSDGSPHALL